MMWLTLARKQALQAVLVVTYLGLLAVHTSVSAGEAPSGGDRGQEDLYHPTRMPSTLPLGRPGHDSFAAVGSTAASPLQLLGKAQKLALLDQQRQHQHQQHLQQHGKQQLLLYKQLTLLGRQPQQMTRSLLAPASALQTVNPAAPPATPAGPLQPSFATPTPATKAAAPAAPAAPVATAAPPAANKQAPAPTFPPPGYFQVVALHCNTPAAGVAGKNCSQWLDGVKSVLSSWGQGRAEAVFLCCNKSLPTTFDVEATEMGVQQSEATMILYYSCSRAGKYEVQIGKYRMPGEGRIVSLTPCSETESKLFIAAPIVP